MSVLDREEPPARAQAKVVERRGLPFCGACRRRLQKADQWRCPYTTCRKWLRGLADGAEAMA